MARSLGVDYVVLRLPWCDMNECAGNDARILLWRNVCFHGLVLMHTTAAAQRTRNPATHRLSRNPAQFSRSEDNAQRALRLGVLVPDSEAGGPRAMLETMRDGA